MDMRFLTKASLPVLALTIMGTFSQFANAQEHHCPQLTPDDCNAQYKCEKHGWSGMFNGSAFDPKERYTITGGDAMFDLNDDGYCSYVAKKETKRRSEAARLSMYPPSTLTITKDNCSVIQNYFYCQG